MGPVSATATIDAPRERVFDLLVRPRRPPAFTDHFLDEFRLAAARLGRGRRRGAVSASASPERVDGDGDRRASSRPHLIRERGRGGRSNRIPVFTVWELAEGAGPRRCEVHGHLLDRARRPVDRLARGARGRGALRRDWSRALERLQASWPRRSAELERVGVAGGDRIGPCSAVEPRRRICFRPRCAAAPSPLCSACSPRSPSRCALGGCGGEEEELEVVEGEPLELGELELQRPASPASSTPTTPRTPSTWSASPSAEPGTAYLGRLPDDRERERGRRAPSADAATRSSTRSRTSIEPVDSESPYALDDRRRRCPPTAQLPLPTRPPPPGRTRARCCSSWSTTRRPRTARSSSRSPAGDEHRQGRARHLGPAPRPARAPRARSAPRSRRRRPSELTIITATASSGSRGGGEGGEPGVELLRGLLARARAPRPGSSAFGPSSAVPVLPATWTPGSAAGDAGAAADHLDHQVAHRRRGLAARSPRPARRRAQLRAARDRGRQPHAAVGDRLRDGRHLQRRRQHLALADRRLADLDARREMSAGSCSRAGRSRRVAAASKSAGGELKPKLLGRLDQLARRRPRRRAARRPCCTSRRSSRRRCRRRARRGRSRSRGRSRVFDVSTGNLSASLTTPASSAAVVGDHLEGRAGRLRRREGDPGERQDRRRCGRRARRRRRRGSPSAAHRRLLERRVDRRPHRPRPATGSLRRRIRSPPTSLSSLGADREQLAAGRAGEALVEGQLEAARCRSACRAGSRGGELRCLRRGRASRPRRRPPRPRARRGARRGRALGERGAVGGEDRRRAAGARVRRSSRSSAVEAREDEVRRPVDRRRPRPAASSSPLELAEGLRLERDRGDWRRRRPRVELAGRRAAAIVAVSGRLARRRARTPRAGTRSRPPGVSSACIASIVAALPGVEEALRRGRVGTRRRRPTPTTKATTAITTSGTARVSMRRRRCRLSATRPRSIGRSIRPIACGSLPRRDARPGISGEGSRSLGGRDGKTELEPRRRRHHPLRDRARRRSAIERGLIASALPLAGFVGGAALGARIGPALLADGSESPYAPLVAVATGVLLGAFLAVALEGVGRALRGRGSARARSGRRRDRRRGRCSARWRCCLPGGSARSPCTRRRPGRARAARGGPAVGDPRGAQRRAAAVGPAAERAAAGRPDAARCAGPTPTSRRRTRERRRRSRGPGRRRSSTVRVLGTACGLGVAGSGWVAGPGLVVTNAHVVAGEDDTTVSPDGRRRARRDRRPLRPAQRPRGARASTASSAPALELAERAAQGRPTRAVIGFPENGPLTFTAGAARAHRAGHQRGLLRPRAGAAADDPVSRRRAQRQLRRPGGRRRRRGPDDRVRRLDRRRAGERARGAERGRRRGARR